MVARRFAAIAAGLALCAGNVAVCAGWQATPEARMACCVNGTSCPMHKSESHKSESRGSGPTHSITQLQADNCCAATSNRTRASITAPTFVLSDLTALPAVAEPVVLLAVPALHEWRAFVPLPVSPVPKHLAFSVLLI